MPGKFEGGGASNDETSPAETPPVVEPRPSDFDAEADARFAAENETITEGTFTLGNTFFTIGDVYDLVHSDPHHEGLGTPNTPENPVKRESKVRPLRAYKSSDGSIVAAVFAYGISVGKDVTFTGDLLLAKPEDIIKARYWPKPVERIHVE